MNATWLSELSGLPRDGVVVTTLANVAAIAEQRGRRALLMGRDWKNWRDLRDNWSELSHRVGIAHAIGPSWLCDAVTHFCQVTQINRETSVRRAQRWARHYIENLLLLSEVPHAMQLDALPGVPCIIVGAGPSLDRNIDVLRHHGRECIVIGVNAGSKALRCDVALSVESNDISHKLGYADLAIYGLSSPPHVMAKAGDRLRPVWNGEIAWIAEEITGIARLPTSGSGSTSAISLAHLWGCDPIVLTGQDLAFTDAHVYAQATGFGDDAIDINGVFDWGSSKHVPRPNNPLPDADEIEHVPSWDGLGTVQSGHAFKAIRHWLGAAAESIGDDARCINATEGGSLIDGWESVRLADVLANMQAGRSRLPEFAGARVSREVVIDWLVTSHHQLAEVWAYGEISGRIEKHREREPRWMPLLEAFAVRAAMRDVDGMLEHAEREIKDLVEQVCSDSHLKR